MSPLIRLVQWAVVLAPVCRPVNLPIRRACLVIVTLIEVRPSLVRCRPSVCVILGSRVGWSLLCETLLLWLSGVIGVVVGIRVRVRGIMLKLVSRAIVVSILSMGWTGDGIT